MTRPSSARSVFGQLKCFQTDDEQLNLNRAVQAAGILDTVKEAHARYKAAVLTYPDLAERLRRAMHLQSAGQWTGFIPPAVDSDDKPCSSPYRAALVAIVREALERGDGLQRGDNVRLCAIDPSLVKAAWKEDRDFQRRADAKARIEAMLGEDAE